MPPLADYVEEAAELGMHVKMYLLRSRLV